MGKGGKNGRFYFPGLQYHCSSDCSHQIKRCLLLGRKAMTNLDSVLKSRDITCSQSPYSQSYGFSNIHVQMWELDHKEGWALRIDAFKLCFSNWCFSNCGTGEDSESPLDSKEIKPVNPKGNQPWLFIGKTEAEALILWPPDGKRQLIGKGPDDEKDWS